MLLLVLAWFPWCPSTHHLGDIMRYRQFLTVLVHWFDAISTKSINFDFLANSFIFMIFFCFPSIRVTLLPWKFLMCVLLNRNVDAIKLTPSLMYGLICGRSFSPFGFFCVFQRVSAERVSYAFKLALIFMSSTFLPRYVITLFWFRWAWMYTCEPQT